LDASSLKVAKYTFLDSEGIGSGPHRSEWIIAPGIVSFSSLDLKVLEYYFLQVSSTSTGAESLL
jgi:hypothetical protein